MLIEIDDHNTWHVRRNPNITRPAVEFRAYTNDPVPIPYLIPDVQLLFKAKHHRPEDELDFENALPRLTPAQRAWLKCVLEQTHPDDPWLPRL